MNNLTGFGLLVALLIVGFFVTMGWVAYVDSTYTQEQICAKQTIVRSAYCDALIEKLRK